MQQIKSDLICEIIRASQTNLLEKKKRAAENGSDDDDRCVTDWILKHARHYRERFCEELESCACKELSEILKELTHSKTDLEEMLAENQVLSGWKNRQNPLNPEGNKKHG